jgi:hypothetical protein
MGKEISYATINRDLLKYPPIQHRHTKADRNYLLPFEFANALAVLALARLQIHQDRHPIAWKVGDRFIAKEGEYRNQHHAKWEQVNKRQAWDDEQVKIPKRKHTFGYGKYHAMEAAAGDGKPRYSRWNPMPHAEALTKAGKQGYADGLRKARQEGLPPTVVIETSRYCILRAAHIRGAGTTVKRVLPALDRLCRPVGPDGKYAPLIVGYQSLPSERLQIEVATDWMQVPYVKVALPVPLLRSATALALFLLLHTLDTRTVTWRGLEFEPLCEVLGIPTHWGKGVAIRDLHQALDLVNQHVATLPYKQRQRDGVPLDGARYDIQFREGKYIRFQIAADVPEELL